MTAAICVRPLFPALDLVVGFEQCSQEFAVGQRVRKKRTIRYTVRTLPTSTKERRYIGSKSHESPSSEGKREASEGLVGFWQHAAPGHQNHNDHLFLYSCIIVFQWHVWLRYGQYRQSHPHPRELCGEWSQHLEVVYNVCCVVAVRLLAGHQALAGSDQNNNRVAGVTSSLIRNTGVKETWRYNTIRDLLSGVQVMLGQAVRGYFSNSLKSFSMPGCLALRTGSLVMVVCHQHDSGMSRAQSARQVGSFSFKQILVAPFQTAIICRLQEWRRSMTSFLTQKGGIA
eukprot:1118660-Pelagomonas_calceolata.AAC.2